MDERLIARAVVAAAEAMKAAEKEPGYKHDSPGSPSATIFSHGPQGNLSFPGVDPAMFNAAVGGQTFLNQLPATPALDTNPTYYTMTGVTDVTGAEKTNVCDNAPVAGLLKSCLTTSVFGRYERATEEIDLPRLGQITDRADPMDLQLIGTPMDGAGGPFNAGGFSTDNPSDLLANEVTRKLWERNVAFHRLVSQQLWVGSPANNSAGLGYMELTGIQTLVNTGYADAQNNQACPAADSIVRDHNFQRVDGANTTIVALLTDVFYQLQDRAVRQGLAPVRWVLAMRPQMFYELTAVWPCVYNTYRCQVNGQERLNLDGPEMVRMRDAMRSGRYLLLDGVQVPVVVDDGIPETTDAQSSSVPAGCFASDIYFLPMSVVGGRSVFFMQYYDYNNPALRAALGQGMVLGRIEGAFLTWPRQTNTCFTIQSVMQPRLVLRTPWLAARLQNVLMCPIQHTRDTFPTDDYFVDGGRTSRAGPSFFSLWQS